MAYHLYVKEDINGWELYFSLDADEVQLSLGEHVWMKLSHDDHDDITLSNRSIYIENSDPRLTGGKVYNVVLSQAEATSLIPLSDLWFYETRGNDVSRVYYFSHEDIQVRVNVGDTLINNIVTDFEEHINENSNQYTATKDLDANSLTIESNIGMHEDQNYTLVVEDGDSKEDNDVTITPTVDVAGVPGGAVRFTKAYINTTATFAPSTIEVSKRNPDPPSLAFAKKVEENTLQLNADANPYLSVGDLIYFFRNIGTEATPVYNEEEPVFLGTVTNISGKDVKYTPNPDPLTFTASQGDFFFGYKNNESEKAGVSGHFGIARVKVHNNERKEVFSIGSNAFILQNE